MSGIQIRKLSASRQSQVVENGKAIIEEHGYRVKISIDLDYNRLTTRQVPHAHNRIQALIQSALITAEMLRGSNPALIEVDELQLPIEMDTDHA